jgi:U2 small nuclear ribonucleoprotein A'
MPATTIDEPRPALPSGKAGRLMSEQDKARVKQAIAKAHSMEEVRRLERSLREGYLPEIEDVGA